MNFINILGVKRIRGALLTDTAPVVLGGILVMVIPFENSTLCGEIVARACI